MTFPDMKSYNEAFNKTVAEIQHGIGQTMVTLGQQALSKIKDRIRETGKDADDTSFHSPKYAGYSEKDMLVGCKSMNVSVCKSFFGKQKNKELKWVTLGGNRYEQFLSASAGGNTDLKRLAVLEGGYKKFRELHGRRTDIVNFSFYNNMWDDIAVVSGPSDHQNGTVIIGARQDIEKKKLSGLTKRFGDILDLSTSEIDELKSDFGLKVLNVFKEHNLA